MLKGIQITFVKPGSAMYAAGLRSGDVVLKVNETDIAAPEQFKDMLASLKPGERATVTFWRNGEVLKTELEF